MKNSTLPGRIHEKLRKPVWTGGQCVHGAVRFVIALRRSVTILRLQKLSITRAAADACSVLI
jgi:hypothetical protein